MRRGTDDDVGLLLNGRYRIVRKLGAGGFATVYEARDETLLSKRVVVKVLHTAQIDEWLLRKFRQEKEALARIDDPGVIAILDEGKTPEDTPFLVMQFVDGGNLRSLVKPGGMELPRAAEILRQIGSALEAAHREGVYHRDLKPENIMLQSSAAGERVRLIDFGIAGIADSVYNSGQQSSRIAGTFMYMSPEQMAGEVSAETDVYAFGAVAFELLTGELAVKSPTQLMAMPAGALEARLRELRPELPPAAAQIVLKALSADPKQRYASAREMGDLLMEALREKPQSPKPRVPRRPLVASAAIVLGLGGAWLAYQKTKPPPPPPKPAAVKLHLDYFAMVQKFQGKKRVGEPQQYANAAVLPEGYGIAVTISSPEAGYLYIVDDGPLPDGSQSINVLYPEYHAPAQLSAGQATRIPHDLEQWLKLDEASGIENLYLVWSSKPVEVFERAKDQTGALTPRGVVIRSGGGVRGQYEELKLVLDRYLIPKSLVAEDSQKTSLTSEQDVLVHLIQLKHL